MSGNMRSNGAMISYFLKKGADPTRTTSTLVNFKRATWSVFHSCSRYSDTYSDTYSDKRDESDDIDSHYDSEEEDTDQNIEDCTTVYGDDQGAEGHVPNLNEKATALHIAAIIGDADIVGKLLHKAGKYFRSRISETESSPLLIAAWLGNMKVVKALLPYEDQFPVKGMLFTPLQAASARGHCDIVEFLLQERDVNEASGAYPTALCAASRHGQIEVAKMLIEHGAEVNPQSVRVVETPLSNAILYAQFAAIQFLLQEGAIFSPALLLEHHESIEEEALEIVMEHALNRQEAKWRYNALCIQCRFGDYDEVCNLLSGRKEMSKLRQLDESDYKNLGHDVPLVIAIKYHHKTIVELLLETDTPIFFRGNIVLAAVKSGDNEMIRLVLADPTKSHLLFDNLEDGVAAFNTAIEMSNYSAAGEIWKYMHELDGPSIDVPDEVMQLVQTQLKNAKKGYIEAKTEYQRCRRLNKTLGLCV
ncbi:hypothetical protein N7523_005528 [Penicillium sp. IBT 18751x]|nr:hypothetical protein N7523_005886 [Penicillium sp. IBT 18751x]KAJ6117777.1 hypothetical protein N7523_005528 [Penicillium sp. IBT 18751x]